MERVSYLAFSAVILAYGTYGVSTNDLYIPRRRHGIQLHDTPAWLVYGAIVCACLVMLSVVVDHYDRRDNEKNYRVFAKTFTVIGWTLFGLSLVFDLVLRGKGT
jgi:TRAP-type C4-dicarboxylate transport system permease small subunit